MVLCLHVHCVLHNPHSTLSLDLLHPCKTPTQGPGQASRRRSAGHWLGGPPPDSFAEGLRFAVGHQSKFIGDIQSKTHTNIYILQYIVYAHHKNSILSMYAHERT